jgi:hypothetical protein
LPVGYLHVVFTVPAEVADIAFRNKAVIYGLLFRAASQTMLTIAADRRHLGARIGITAVLHTWGSAMTHHPHIHLVVPGGGISLDGERRIFSRAAFLLPVRVLSKPFRRLFLTRLYDLHAAARLHFFGDHAEFNNPMTLGGVTLYWERPGDLSAALARVKADPTIAPHLSQIRRPEADAAISSRQQAAAELSHAPPWPSRPSGRRARPRSGCSG